MARQWRRCQCDEGCPQALQRVGVRGGFKEEEMDGHTKPFKRFFFLGEKKMVMVQNFRCLNTVGLLFSGSGPITSS